MDLPKANFNQVLCACADGFAALFMATLLGYTSTAMLLMKNDPDFEINDEQASWIGASVPGMALIGSLLAGRLMEAFGRKRVAITMSLPAIFGWLVVARATNAYHVIGARLLSGFCLGVQQVTVSVYVSETLHPKLKPMLSVIPGLTAMTGFFIINVAGAIVGWREMALLGAAFCLPLFLLLQFVLPETPYYLLKSDKSKESLNAMKWIRQSDMEAEKEFKELELSISSEKSKDSISLSDLLKPPYRWPFCTAILLHVFQQTTGISAISTFTGLIFERANSTVDPVIFPAVMTAVNIGAVFAVGKTLPKYKRKVFINFSSRVAIISLLVLSSYFWVKESNGILKDASDSLTYIPPIAFLFYVVAFSLGWGPLPWMFISEGLPMKIRSTGAGIVIATNWAFNFLTTKTFILTMNSYGNYAIFLFYAICTFIGMHIMSFYIPETFGLSETQLEKYYKDSYKLKTK